MQDDRGPPLTGRHLPCVRTPTSTSFRIRVEEVTLVVEFEDPAEAVHKTRAGDDLDFFAQRAEGGEGFSPEAKGRDG